MNMNFNKIAAAFLIAGIAVVGAGVASEEIFKDHHAKENAAKRAYVIADGVPIDTGSSTEPAKKVIEPVSALLAAADPAAGQAVAKKCATCHDFTKGGPNKIGPNLWEIVGNKHGHAAGFAYSEVIASMKEPWGYEELNKFFAAPKEYAPGTKMNFLGLPKVADRAALIAYLRTLSDSPVPLPAAQ